MGVSKWSWDCTREKNKKERKQALAADVGGFWQNEIRQAGNSHLTLIQHDLFEKSGQPHTEQPSVFIRFLPVPQGPKDPKIHPKNPQPNNRTQESYTQSERLDTVQEFKMSLEELELQIDILLM